MSKQIGIVLFDGMEELDFAGPWEVLAAWARGAPEDGYSVTAIAPTREPVTCAHGLRILGDTTWDDVGELSVLVVPGGNSSVLRADAPFIARLGSLAAGGTLVASVCTGALALLDAGLLDGIPATTHWGALDRLRDAGVDVRADDRFVDAGNVITAAGVSAGIDMALHLVARLSSVERAREVRRYIQYDPAPPV
jgi:transcriptional regulator GlxA family with amidase domain